MWGWIYLKILPWSLLPPCCCWLVPGAVVILLGAFLFNKFWKKFFKFVLSGALGLDPFITPTGGLTGVLIDVVWVLVELFKDGFESS